MVNLMTVVHLKARVHVPEVQPTYLLVSQVVRVPFKNAERAVELLQ